MKDQLPIRRMLEEYDRKNMDRWHMPGHKGTIESFPGSWDVTEVDGSDNLHHPTEGIAEAQKLLAEAAGLWLSSQLTWPRCVPGGRV